MSQHYNTTKVVKNNVRKKGQALSSCIIDTCAEHESCEVII